MRLTRLLVPFLLSLTAVAGAAARTEWRPGEDESARRQRDFLAWEAGTWACEIEVLDLATGQWASHRGEQTDRLGACGLWLITDLRMTAGPGGQSASPYEGHGVLGYDPVERELVGLWVDSKTDWLATSAGSVASDGRTLRLTVQARDPGSGARYEQEFVTTKVDEDHRRLEVLVPTPSGASMPVARITSRRTGKAPAGH